MGFAAFFSRALRRDPVARFGNAEEMLRAWREAFSPLDRAAVSADSIEVIARRLDRASTIAEVGYGVEAREVLDRMGIHTVNQLLGVPRLKFRYLTGVGDRIRREIRERAKRVAQLRPDLVSGGITENDGGRATVDRLAEQQLLPRRPAGDERPEDRILAYYPNAMATRRVKSTPQRKSQKKTVFLVGAGFSAGLGYPLVNDLLIRLWPIIPENELEDLEKVIAFHLALIRRERRASRILKPFSRRWRLTNNCSAQVEVPQPVLLVSFCVRLESACFMPFPNSFTGSGDLAGARPSWSVFVNPNSPVIA